MPLATRTTVTRDPAVVALTLARAAYPGASALLDAADRAWLRLQGVDVPDRAPAVPLHEAARRARFELQNKAGKKKNRRAKKDA